MKEILISNQQEPLIGEFDISAYLRDKLFAKANDPNYIPLLIPTGGIYTKRAYYDISLQPVIKFNTDLVKDYIILN